MLEKVIGKLNPRDYWEWRTAIVEMQLAQEKFLTEQLKLVNMEKDLEIGRLRALIFKAQNLEPLKDKHVIASRAYNDLKLKLEQKLKHSLNNCVINDITYEVSQFEEKE